MNKMYVTKKSQLLKSSEMLCELVKEVNELGIGIYKTDINNIGEELMDILQWVINISHKYNLDLNKEILKHQAKLLNRGHEFIIK